MTTSNVANKLSVSERLRLATDKSGECWVITKLAKGRKYPALSVNGQLVQAHRLAWTLERGPIPDGLKVLHRCDNRRCVRVDHLFLGTQLDNIADMVMKGRSRSPRGEKNGNSKLSDAEVRELRRMGETASTYELARRFGISPSYASKLMNGRNRARADAEAGR